MNSSTNIAPNPNWIMANAGKRPSMRRMWIAIETANVISNDDENMHRIIPHLILVLLSMMNCAVSTAALTG